MPCGTKMPVNRVTGFAAVFARGVCAGNMASSSGNASVIPAPRKNDRRAMCFLEMNICFCVSLSCYSPFFGAAALGSSALSVTTSFSFIWNGWLFTTPSTRDENL